MSIGFDEALEIAEQKYPHPINHYQEYEKYFVFCLDDGIERTGGDKSPIVIRKSDGAALNYAPIFFNLEEGAYDAGKLLSEGSI